MQSRAREGSSQSGQEINPYEARNRLQKAIRLARTWQQAGLEAGLAERATNKTKEILAEAAGTRFPSDKTWGMVINILENETEEI